MSYRVLMWTLAAVALVAGANWFLGLGVVLVAAVVVDAVEVHWPKRMLIPDNAVRAAPLPSFGQIAPKI